MAVIEGKKAPAFTAVDQDGQKIKLADFKGKKLALYFYPKDATSTCTEQACNLRDGYKELSKKGIEVVGVSPDDEKSHLKFIAKQALPFRLIADTDKTLCEKFGVWAEKSMYGKKYMGVERTTFLVGPDGKIAEIGAWFSADEVIDISGLVVFPGFVDLHAHLREPGREDTETIETGSRAGAKGGYTAVVAMPNTDPAQDNVPTIEFVRLQGQRAGLLEVVPSGCITVGRQGKALAPMAKLAKAGVHLFTDDGSGVQDPLLMRRAMEYSKQLNVVLGQHCEVSALTQGAVMHECGCSSDLGVPGWPSLAEELMVHRDIELARLTGARIHFLHLSTAGSVDLVRQAKRDGLPVTAEVTPHHLSLTAELLREIGRAHV
jgi:dihydroorotase-like cyclic amidohydrolase